MSDGSLFTPDTGISDPLEFADERIAAAAAWGMITADLPADVREHRIDVANGLADTVLTFEQLAATARTVNPPPRLMAAGACRAAVPGSGLSIVAR
jgi:hypothetical protein